jgi:hypothetical protein
MNKEPMYPESFILWIDFGTHDFYLNAEKDQIGYYREGEDKTWTLAEVYKFWQDEIKDK